MSPTRREFLAGAAATAGVLAAAGCSSSGSKGASAGPTKPGSASPASTTTTSTVAPIRTPPDGASSGIDHIVVLMMENRSFDHILGWLPGADGRQEGLSYRGHDGQAVATHHLKDFQGCAHPDPDHSYEGGRVQLNGGTCDGFLVSGRNDEFAIGYYTPEDLPFSPPTAQHWCTLDRYFAATMAETYPNRFYQHSAATDRTHNAFKQCTLPTIWDRLAAKGVSAGYYFTDVPFIALYGGTYGSITKPLDAFLQACESGTLPAVSFVDPKFTNEDGGTSEDDHPHGDIRAGQAFLNRIYEAVTTSPKWDRTLLVINYDEWGGFFDHVAPTVAPDLTPKAGTGLRGFRVPSYVIGPWVRRGSIGHEVYDHTSILKMIEWRHDLAPLTPRDKAARNLAEVLDLRAKPNTDAPKLKVPAFDSMACSAAPAATHASAWTGDPAADPVEDPYAEWRHLRRLADLHHFPAAVRL